MGTTFHRLSCVWAFPDVTYDHNSYGPSAQTCAGWIWGRKLLATTFASRAAKATAKALHLFVQCQSQFRNECAHRPVVRCIEGINAESPNPVFQTTHSEHFPWREFIVEVHAQVETRENTVGVFGTGTPLKPRFAQEHAGPKEAFLSRRWSPFYPGNESNKAANRSRILFGCDSAVEV